MLQSTDHMNVDPNYDIAIVGGGLVGMALAVALGQHFNIVLIEKKTIASIQHPKVDDRPLTLSHASHRILQGLEVWAKLKNPIQTLQRVNVSAERSPGTLHLNASDIDVAALGYVLSFHDLTQALYTRVTSMAKITWMNIQAINAVHCTNDAACINVQMPQSPDAKNIHADVMIACDGTDSTVSELLGVPTWHERSFYTAAVAQIMLKQPHQATAYQRFTTRGSLALLPLSDPHSMRVVWTLPSQQQRTYCHPEKVVDFLHNSFRGRIPGITGCELLNNWPLGMRTVKQSMGKRWLLMGNAAHTLYPIAAQGFNLSLYDIAWLADLFIEAKQAQQSAPIDSLLKRYVALRRKDHWQTQQLTRMLMDETMFSLPMMPQLRGFVLWASDVLSPLKHYITKRGAGLYGRLPRLACAKVC